MSAARDGGVRTDRVSATRGRILNTAERLFAERGVFSVSNRQVSVAAGQGNNTAVGYHFGDKLDLVSAIVRRHFGPLEQRRESLVARAGESTDIRDWVGCLVLPMTAHLDALEDPTWFARFNAQLTTDPALRALIVEEASTTSVREVVDRIRRCSPDLPDDVRAERHDMARNLITHICAERERALADGTPSRRPTWAATGAGLIDAIVAIWQAPVTET
ncbi:TetR/AcrR family transcriptional regulator [Solicola gregarius]|uniref:TetR family transcriptional regulator n=1 Tax=Solicola gregarius TaxID=2908642 RepID=A0AA46TIK6_9ACTN|nr:TetR family transcriptional regulator [Solicola gregarius]UYM06007.1 TetR family transcriptional regulator [Solicola gregarius]